ncbi:MAG: protein TolQ [Candidatus Aminicenantes bacterium]|nr:protein TolQ [Candidatus Aminicenantes bacterium]
MTELRGYDTLGKQPKKMTLFRLVLEANIIVQLVLIILLLFSVFSWAIIIFKRNTFREAAKHSEGFLHVFRRSRNLNEVNEASRQYRSSPLVALFQAGYRELISLSSRHNPPSSQGEKPNLNNLQRALLRASNAEISKMERMMSFLATTGSVTPFIGLFGTVIGIMDAFHKIGIVRSASLSTVAPGIAEALVATAAGLFAAIPAVIAYNHFLHRIKDTITQMEDFSLEFLNMAEKLYGS